MKRAIYVVCVVAVVWATSSLHGQPRRSPEFNRLMVDKLRYAQRLLEGLAMSDFDKIADSADNLIRLTKSEEWFAYRTPRYELHSNDFRRAAETIAQKAQLKNIDGVALGYVDLTLTCVRCHQHVREIRDARLPALPGSSSTALARGDGPGK